MQAIACKSFRFFKIVDVGKSCKYFINGSLLKVGEDNGIADGLSELI